MNGRTETTIDSTASTNNVYCYKQVVDSVYNSRHFEDTDSPLHTDVLQA